MTKEPNVDENAHVLTGLDAYKIAISTPSDFLGGTSNARGDKDGTNATFTLFTVTGDVLVRIFGVCTTTIVGAGTLEVGVEGNVAGLIARIADATDLVANEIWNDASPTEVGVGLLASVLGPYLIVNGNNIIETVGTADLTAGQVYYVCLWKPVTNGSNLVGLAS